MGKWLFRGLLAMVAVFLLLAATSCFHAAHRAATFPELPLHERELAIYDAMTSHIGEQYYDQTFIDGPWPAIRDGWRKKAATATSDADLYPSVLQRVVHEIPSSHVWPNSPQELEARRREAAARSTSQSTADTKSAGSETALKGYYLNENSLELPILYRKGGMRVVVGDVGANSAAARAGIEPGWLAQSFSRDTRGHFIGEFVRVESLAQKLQLDAGSLSDAAYAHLNALPTTKIEFDLQPHSPEPAMQSHSLAGDVLYLRFDTFFDVEAMNRIVKLLAEAPAAGVVIDLRRNDGGLAQQAARFLSALLPSDAAVCVVKTRKETFTQRAPANAVRYAGPVVVLIGPGSSSAAEVTAAALQDHERALLVGRYTRGAALATEEFSLPDGGTVSIAFADLRRVNGGRIEAVGVAPDVHVMPTLEDVRAGRDVALERALVALAKPPDSGS